MIGQSSSARISSVKLILYLLVWVSWAGLANASSSPRPPLTYLEHPAIQSVEIVSRQNAAQDSRRRRTTDTALLRHSDSFRLTLTAFSQTFRLHLRPNDQLIHPSARINYFMQSPDVEGAVPYRSEPLLRESVRVYLGDVVGEDDSPRRMREDASGGLWKPWSPTPEGLGWARIIVHEDGDPDQGIPPLLEGAFSVGGVVHHITPKETYLKTKRPFDTGLPIEADVTDSRLVIFRNSDHRSSDVPVPPHAHSCSADTLDFNTDPLLNPALRPSPPTSSSPWGELFPFSPSSRIANHSLWRRDDIGGAQGGSNFAGSIGQTIDCPKTDQILYMGVAADCRYTSNYGSTENATRAILNDWNLASARYKSTFNVSLGIVQLNVHDATCPQTPDPTAAWNVDCSADFTLNDRLSAFSAWRGTRSSDGIGLWHLMSGCPTGTEVGVAWLGTLCQTSATGAASDVVSGTAVSTFGTTEWEVVTHEIGHNFGAIHDCSAGCTQSPCCPFTTTQCSTSALFIMNPESAPSETTFSPCSIGNICTSLKTALNQSCLIDATVATTRTITLQMCGNGIVEPGEDCDPGQGISSPCCNSATCKFVAGALCDPESSPCCTSQCQFAPTTQVCRPAVDATCDVPELCTGTSANCPADVTKPNGLTCGHVGSDTLTCASGQCTSISQQCQQTGGSLNLTSACSQQASTGCQLSCQDPSSPDRCLVLQATLPNGSACGYGGTCASGTCQAGNLLDTAKAWYLQNLQISVPVTVVAVIVAIMLIFAVFSLARSCCRRRRDSLDRDLAGPASPSRDGRPTSQETLLPQGYTSAGPFPEMSAVVPSMRTSREPDPRLAPMGNTSRGMQRSSGSYLPVPRFPNGARVPRSRSSANDFDVQRGRVPQSPPMRTRSQQQDWVDDRMYNGPLWG